MLYKETIAVFSQFQRKHVITAVWAERRIFKCQTGGIYSDHWSLSVKMCIKKSNHLMLYWEIIAVCFQIHTKHINTAV